MRKQGNCLEKEMMQGTMPGARRRGRPRTAWIDNIKSWTGLPIWQETPARLRATAGCHCRSAAGSRRRPDNRHGRRTDAGPQTPARCRQVGNGPASFCSSILQAFLPCC